MTKIIDTPPRSDSVHYLAYSYHFSDSATTGPKHKAPYAYCLAL
jgi:hypothetical protein